MTHLLQPEFLACLAVGLVLIGLSALAGFVRGMLDP